MDGGSPISDSLPLKAAPPPLMILAYLRVAGHDQGRPKSWPSISEVVEEMKEMCKIGGPMLVVGLIFYGRAAVSMLFLGRLGKHELAGGSLSIGFANITGYSILSGLALGMEPISSQAFGAKRYSLMCLTLQRTILILLVACLPISLLWLKMKPILLLCGQDPIITSVASTYLAFSLPDLFFQAVLHPLRIYLRTQGITRPLTLTAALALVLHIPINLWLVLYMGLGVRGVALSMVVTDFNLVASLLVYLWFCGVCGKGSWEGWSLECLREWRPLLSLAIPSCASVCLEWWWYELMIIFSGLLSNASDAVATMGILLQTTSLVYIFPSSLSLAVSTRIGNELGANRPNRAKVAMFVAVCCAFMTGIMALTFTTTLRNVWGWVFTSDRGIVALTARAMPLVGLCELGNCPQTTGCGVLRGSARPSLGAHINLGSFYVIGMPVALLMGFVANLGFLGLWLGLLAAQGSCALLMMCALAKTDWALQASRARELTGGAVDCKPVRKVVSETTKMSGSNSYKVEVAEMLERAPLISIKVVQPND
ncbi:protein DETOXIFICATION 48-like [Nymphaea colorata]|nr:protein DETOXIFICATION 48-like [Nymphaea colorata]